MPVGGSGPSLLVGAFAGLALSWWVRPSPSLPAPVPSSQVAPVPFACPASEGWASWAVGAAFVLGLFFSLCLALIGGCAVFGAGFLWARFYQGTPQRRTAADRLAGY